MRHSSACFFIVAITLMPVFMGCRGTWSAAAGEKKPDAGRAPVRHLPAIGSTQSTRPGSVRFASLLEPSLELPPPSLPLDDDSPVFTLSQAVRLAYGANPDLESAAQQIAAADASLARARADFYPRLGISQQYGVTNNPVMAFMFQLNQAQLSLAQDFNNPPTVDNFQTQLLFQQRLYAGEQRAHAVHAAAAQTVAASLNLDALHNRLSYRIAEAYYRLLQARDLVSVRREAVAQVQQQLEIVQTRFRNDTAVRSDVLTVEVRLAEEREALIAAQNQQELAWAVLENVIGAPVETRMLPDSIPVAPWSDQIDGVEAAISAAIGRRAEVGAAASQRQAAVEQLLVAQAGKRLTIDATADYDVFTGDFSQANDSFFAGLVVQLNLFDGGRTRTDVARALANVRRLEAGQRRVMLDIELEVRRAYLQLQDARQRREVATQAIAQARESLREIEVRYQGGTATITEMVDAQVALSDARVRRTTADAEVEIARAALQRAIGRLDSLVGRQQVES